MIDKDTSLLRAVLRGSGPYGGTATLAGRGKTNATAFSLTRDGLQFSIAVSMLRCKSWPAGASYSAMNTVTSFEAIASLVLSTQERFFVA